MPEIDTPSGETRAEVVNMSPGRDSGGAFYRPFDPEYTRTIVDKVFRPVLDDYFRPRILGAHRVRRDGPVILTPNHSGNAFPYDGMVLDSCLWRRDGYDPRDKFVSVFEKELALTWWMRPYGIDNFWRRCGGVDLTFDNFDHLLDRGERIIYYPEGVPGIGKGFGRRYQLQRFSSSFVIQAAKHNAPVHPVYIINAEWVIPFNYTLPPVDWLMHKLFHVPYLPLPGALFAITFPWAWYLALPARMVIVIDDPIDVRAMVEAAGERDLERPDRARMRAVAEQIRVRMQAELDRHVERYGRTPYHARSLWRRLRRARRRGTLGRVLPTGWAASFVRHERDRHRPPARGRLRRMVRDWDLIGFYLPFGWPLLSLARAFRRPPCGYRGLSAEERREIEGRFLWRLDERPLPPRDAG